MYRRKPKNLKTIKRDSFYDLTDSNIGWGRRFQFPL